MARNRSTVATQEKRTAIVKVARQLFLADGYEATGMARIAAVAGVAPNTLYWYFDDKDALLVAVLDELIGDALREFMTMQSAPHQDQILWLLERLERTPGLMGTVHARATVSPAVDTWHTNFHRLLESMIVAQLAASGVPEHERRPAAQLTMFVVDGLMTHAEATRADRKAILALLASRLERGSPAEPAS